MVVTGLENNDNIVTIWLRIKVKFWLVLMALMLNWCYCCNNIVVGGGDFFLFFYLFIVFFW